MLVVIRHLYLDVDYVECKGPPGSRCGNMSHTDCHDKGINRRECRCSEGYYGFEECDDSSLPCYSTRDSVILTDAVNTNLGVCESKS